MEVRLRERNEDDWGGDTGSLCVREMEQFLFLTWNGEERSQAGKRRTHRRSSLSSPHVSVAGVLIGLSRGDRDEEHTWANNRALDAPR